MTCPMTVAPYRCLGVSSDCMPVDARVELAPDPASGLISANLTPEWESKVKHIYENYAIYTQAAGAEQLVFDQRSGAGASRSSQIVERALVPHVRAPRGRCLDIGCGNGALLRAFAARFPGWSLEGTEFDAKNLPTLEKIPGFAQLHTSKPLDQLPRGYDLVSLVHVLEHLTDPLSWLRQVRELLSDGGLMLIELPYFVENPFELAIYDRCTHFTQASLRRLVQAAGFDVLHLGSDLVPKEITLVARPAARKSGAGPTASIAELEIEARRLQLAATWLDETLALALASVERWSAAKQPAFLFGSSIAATLIHTHGGGKFASFIDEDKNRQGSKHLGVPIVGFAQVPESAGVFVGLTPAIAAGIRQRALPRSQGWIVPQAFPEGLLESPGAR